MTAASGYVGSAGYMGNILKTLWKDDFQDIFYEESPLFAMLPKRTDWSGDVLTVPVQYGQVNGRSAAYDRARANSNRSKFSRMQITTNDNFAVWAVEHKLMLQSRNDKGAVIRAIEHETKSAMKKFKRSLGYMIWGNGGGAVGQIASGTTLTTNVLKFVSPQSLRQVEEGDVLTFAADDGSGPTPGGIRGGAVRLQVTGVDPESQTVTVGAYPTGGATTLNAVTSIAVGDYVFLDGDYASVLYGIPAYVPSTAPSTSIWNMPRSTSKRRLGGIRISGKGLLVHEAIKKALKVARDEGASISHVFVSTDEWLTLELTLGADKRMGNEDVTAKVGFECFLFTNGSGKPVKVFADPDCPVGFIYGLQMDTWTLHSMGAYPDFLDTYGASMDFIQDTSVAGTKPSFEGRIGGYAQLYTDAPGYNFVLTLNS